jgi:hypothetical protein
MFKPTASEDSSDADDYDYGPVDYIAPSPPDGPSENITISDDRSAGSNVEARNLAVLTGRTISKDMLDQVDVYDSWLEQERRNRKFDLEVDLEVERIREREREQELRQFERKRERKREHEREGSDISSGHIVLPLNVPSMRHLQMQKRFGELRPSEEASVDTETLLESLDIGLKTTESDWASKERENQCEGGKEGSKQDSSDRLRTNIENLQRRVAHMQETLHEMEMQQQKKARKRYQVLYRLDRECYLDHPEWTRGQASMVSRKPLHNFDLFLERNKNIVFVVYRDFGRRTRVKHDNLKPQSGNVITPPEHITESVRIIDKQLLASFESLLEQDWRYDDDLQLLRRTGEMNAPYLFIYHHRRSWTELLSRCSDTVRKHLNLLTDYISKNYGHEYMAADASFRRRKITVDLVKYLFQPGDTLISKDDGQCRGLVAKSWPDIDRDKKLRLVEGEDESDSYDHGPTESDVGDSDMNSDSEHHKTILVGIKASRNYAGGNFKGREAKAAAKKVTKTFRVEAWKWSFDGDFKKAEGLYSFQLSTNSSEMSKEWDLHDLDIYPLRYAPEALICQIRCRGEMLWACRKRCLVSYRHTNAGEQQEVSVFPIQKLRSYH